MHDFTPNPPKLQRGMTISMTGAWPDLTRDSLVAAAAEHGIVWKKNMSAIVDVLVCEEPTSQSGKARKARQLGNPVVPYSWLMNGMEQLRRESRMRRSTDARQGHIDGHASASAVDARERATERPLEELSGPSTADTRLSRLERSV